MFGIAIASLSQVSEAERERYQALYCGLCLTLKRRYGQISRAALSYDLAFLVMLYDSLYEPDEEVGAMHCIAHPRKSIPFSISEFDDYCADLSIALAYHKCLDDIVDDDSKAAKAVRIALAGSYSKAQERIPEQCRIISDAMQAIRSIEGDPAGHLPDEASIAFGQMLGFLMECLPGLYPDMWSQTLRRFGYWLGRFIYMMDAAVDLAQDERSHSYNPFLILEDPELRTHEAIRTALSPLIANAIAEFDRLPLVQDVHLMESVLFSGVWQKFNRVELDG